MIKTVTCFMALALATAAGAAEKGKTASAKLKDPQGKQVGTAVFSEKQGKVEVRVKVSGLPPGKHGIHVHETGKCDPPAFSGAGSHFNPSAKRHGALNPEGKHAGDLPNLEVKADGTGEVTAPLDGVNLKQRVMNSLLKPGGTALVIHAGPDDEKTDPTGNSGDRIACGVIEAK